MMLKIGVLERAGAAPLAGICPSCNRVMDESGCRVQDPVALTTLAHDLGVGRIYEVWCYGPSLTHTAQIAWDAQNP
jgi:hypothetical protein